MAANTSPIYSIASDLQNSGKFNGGTVLGQTANTATDGTGTFMYQTYVGSGSNGNFVQKCIFKALGSPAATVIRVWWGSFTGTYTASVTNNLSTMSLLAELTTAAWTLSQVLASPQYEVPLNVAVPTGTSILVSFGTASGSTVAGFTVTAVAGQY